MALMPLLIGLHFSAFSQGETQNWFYANSSSAISFAGGVPSILPFSALPDSGEGCASISDAQGNLLFYSNGERVWDRNHDLMPNGTGLLGDSGSTQAALIVPRPGSDSLYYLFTTAELGSAAGLRYNEIDISLNAGLGDITANKNLPIHPSVTEKLTSVRHANGIDYWVIAHEWQTNVYLAYLVDATGVSNIPVLSAVGSAHDGWDGFQTLIAGAGGYMRASPRGDKLAVSTFIHNLREIADFDNATGSVSNVITLPATNDIPYGIEFSPDGSKVYFGTSNTWSNYIEQVNLDDCFPLQNIKTIANISIFTPPGALQMGPDGKIYVFVDNGNPFDQPHYLGVINEPNNLGVACDYQDSVLYVGDLDQCLGLPNFITTWFSPYFHYDNKCFGDSTAFTFTNPFNLPIDSVAWNFGDPGSGTANTSTLLNPTHVFTAPDTFSVDLTYFIGGVGNDTTYSVVIHGLPIPDLGFDTTLCTGQTDTLDAYLGPDTYYTWSTGSGDSTLVVDAATIAGQDTFWVEICRYQCVARDSIVVAVDVAPPVIDLGPDTLVCDSVYLLDPGLSSNIPIQWNSVVVSPTLTVDSSGTYIAIAGNGCGTDSDTVVVTLSDIDSVNLGPDTNLCPGVTYQLQANVTGGTFNWQDGSTNSDFNVNTAGQYWVEVTIPNCGTTSDTVNVLFDLPATAINLLPAADTVACDGDTVHLRSPGSTNHTFAWSTGSGDSTIAVTTSGTYSLTVTNICGTLNEAIMVSFAEAPAVSLPADTGFCEGDTLAINLNQNAFTTYTWQDGITTASRIIQTGGTYTLFATNTCGSASDSIGVLINPFPVVDLGPDQTYCGTLNVVLQAGINDVSYLWTGGFTTAQLTVPDSGTYYLTVTDSLGCSGIDSVRVYEFCQTIFNVSNVLTPNFDGVNDLFLVDYQSITNYAMDVYDRWGNHIYHSEQPDEGWDGSSDAGPLPSGVYYYVIQYTDVRGEAQQEKGSVTLLRD